MTANISGVAYVLIGYTIRMVVYCVVYTAVYVFIVGLVLDEKSERFFKRERTWAMPEQRDNAAIAQEQRDETCIQGTCEIVNQ